jgi:DNA-binding LytR/AlgR family response regulator
MNPHSEHYFQSNAKINCIVVDDEPIARKGILEYIRQISYLNCVAQCKNAPEAAGILHEQRVDLMFLDVQMPEMTGLEFIKSLPHPPLIILITAFPQYALEGFNLNVTDYLLKPVSMARFIQAVEKARISLEKNIRTPDNQDSEFIYLKINSRIEKVILNEIIYIEALANYVIFHTGNQKLISYLTINGVEQQLPQDKFIRIHKSFIVAVKAIKSIADSEVTTICGSIPIGKLYSRNLQEIVNSRLLKR